VNFTHALAQDLSRWILTKQRARDGTLNALEERWESANLGFGSTMPVRGVSSAGRAPALERPGDGGRDPGLPGSPLWPDPQHAGSHAADIVGDFFESDEWGELVDAEAEPDLELPPLPPHHPEAS
jgi:hypothetical protein